MILNGSLASNGRTLNVRLRPIAVVRRGELSTPSISPGVHEPQANGELVDVVVVEVGVVDVVLVAELGRIVSALQVEHPVRPGLLVDPDAATNRPYTGGL